MMSMVGAESAPDSAAAPVLETHGLRPAPPANLTVNRQISTSDAPVFAAVLHFDLKMALLVAFSVLQFR